MTAPTAPAEFWHRLLVVVDETKPQWKRTDDRNQVFCTTDSGVVRLRLFESAHGNPFRVDLLDANGDPLASLEVSVAHKLRLAAKACWDEAQAQFEAADTLALSRAADVADAIIRDLTGGDRG